MSTESDADLPEHVGVGEEPEEDRDDPESQPTTLAGLVSDPNPELIEQLLKEVDITRRLVLPQITSAYESMRAVSEGLSAPIRAAHEHALSMINSTSGVDAAVRAMTADLLSPQSAALAAFSTSLFTDDFFGPSGALATITGQWARQSAAIHSYLQNTRRINWGIPPNLASLDDVWIRDYGPVVITDGIPLYGVPRARIAEALIKADSSEERWDLLGRHWESITSDCRDLLMEHQDSERFSNYIYFAVAAAAALAKGHPEAAQALTATVLDNLKPWAAQVAAEFTEKSLWPTTEHISPTAFEELPVRMHLTFGPLWQALKQFWSHRGDPIPQEFSRHATVHTLDRGQFTTVNAVQGLMVVTSLLYLLLELEADEDYQFGN